MGILVSKLHLIAEIRRRTFFTSAHHRSLPKGPVWLEALHSSGFAFGLASNLLVPDGLESFCGG